MAQLEQERFVANKRAQHLDSELNDKKKVYNNLNFILFVALLIQYRNKVQYSTVFVALLIQK